MPDQPNAKHAQWLSLKAAWLLRYLHDADAAKKVLGQLVHEFPATPQAFAAQRRLSLLEMDDRMQKVKAGTSGF